MRVLLLFRGAAGCGKSTFIEKHGLKPYTLCADDIRMLYASPTLQVDGTRGISQDNDKQVWNALFRILETRMQNGEFTVIDATNSKTAEMKRYKDLANNYRYRIYIIDMTDIPIEEVKRRNAQRNVLKRVPEEVIDKMYSRFETQQIPTGIKVLKPEELNTIWYRPMNLDEYKKIHVIGDIHGCYTALREYIIKSYFDKIPQVNNNKLWDYSKNEYWKNDRWLSIEDFESEVWKDIIGYEGLYQISNFGRVKSNPKRKGVVYQEEPVILKASLVSGYLQVVLSKDDINQNVKLHRLVAEHFIDNPDSLPEVNHKNTNRCDNYIDNLEWCTSQENIQHSVAFGNWHTKIIGQYNKDGKFIKAYLSAMEAERETGIDNSAIRKVCNHTPKCNTAGGYIWKNVDEIDLADFIRNDSFYIFSGDYIDRGIENAETLKLLCKQSGYKNVVLLEGNHERWLWMWANDITTKSREFEFITKPQLEKGKISKKDVREFYRRLGQCCYFIFNNQYFIVTHGGISNIPIRAENNDITRDISFDYNLLSIPTYQMIKGVGTYNDADLVDQAFTNNTYKNVYQIHGHRNITNSPVQITDRTFNLEGQVEFGGNLRAVQISKDGIVTVEIKNDVFKDMNALNENEYVMVEDINKVDMSVYEMVESMRRSKYIYEKQFGRISSFNFTKQAFEKEVWDEITNKARGLYIDNVDYRIVARSYDKFFNINERPETKFNNLRYKLQFPVSVYVKENGFLGIVGYNPEADDLLITSKSSPTSNFSEYLRNNLYSIYGEQTMQNIKDYIKANDVSFVFECCDMEHDPHIIEYLETKVVLLDVIKNHIEYEKLPYDELVSLANEMGLVVKEKACDIATWEDFFVWYNEVIAEDYKYNDEYIEGFVIEDSVGYMTKLKLHYYKFWKRLRSVAQSVLKYGNYKYTGSLLTPLENEFFGWCKTLFVTLSSEEKIELRDKSYTNICSMRNMFFNWLKENGKEVQ